MAETTPEEGSRRRGGLRLASRGLVDCIVYFACFPLVTTVASLIGAAFVAMLVAGHYTFQPGHASLRMVWAPLVNSIATGACLGALWGALSTIAYKLFRPNCDLRVSADRALDVMQGPLFWIGLANGLVVGLLTISTFQGALIYAWPVFSHG